MRQLDMDTLFSTVSVKESQTVALTRSGSFSELGSPASHSMPCCRHFSFFRDSWVYLSLSEALGIAVPSVGDESKLATKALSVTRCRGSDPHVFSMLAEPLLHSKLNNHLKARTNMSSDDLTLTEHSTVVVTYLTMLRPAGHHLSLSPHTQHSHHSTPKHSSSP